METSMDFPLAAVRVLHIGVRVVVNRHYWKQSAG